MSQQKTVGIVSLVPGGQFCEGARTHCQFLINCYNDPSRYCFFIPESHWPNHELARKHPKCPSLKDNKRRKPVAKGMTEEQSKMLRMKIWQEITLHNALLCPKCGMPLVLGDDDNECGVEA